MADFLSSLKQHPLIAILRGITPTEVINIATVLIAKE
jgi:2-keto-3-deoxy-6-phosphogluconate aldolase